VDCVIVTWVLRFKNLKLKRADKWHLGWREAWQLSLQGNQPKPEAFTGQRQSPKNS